MLEQICAHIHNYFVAPEDVVAGEFIIVGGEIDLTGLVLEGQYFRIVDSALNDGVYRYPAEGLSDETFDGEIQPMRVPRAFMELVEEIEAWQAQYGVAMASPFQAEKVIGVYSYTKQGGNTSVNGTAAEAAGWTGAFKTRLNPWRKLR